MSITPDAKALAQEKVRTMNPPEICYLIRRNPRIFVRYCLPCGRRESPRPREGTLTPVFVLPSLDSGLSPALQTIM